MASALQAGVGGLLAAQPVWESSVGPFLRLLPPLLGGFLFARWRPGRAVFGQLAGGGLIGGLSTLAGMLLALPLRGSRLGVEVVLVSAAGAGVVLGLAGGGLGATVRPRA